MAGVYPKLPNVIFRDSFEEDDQSDIDDEVFIQDRTNSILEFNKDRGAKRPLMAPHRKYKTHFSEISHLSYKTLFAPFCYTLLGFFIILGILILCMITITRFPITINLLKTWLFNNKDKAVDKHIIPCTSLNSKIQWTRTLPKLTSVAPFRSNDVNRDNTEDIIVGFSTGLDKADTSKNICSLNFNHSTPCLGGVLALDGKSGETIWTHWTAYAVFSVDCGLDLNKDNVKDCIASGYGGILHAINGKDGSSIWELQYKDISMLSQQRYYDAYDARYISDIDDDGIGDVIASHTWQFDGLQSEIILISGKNGNKINSMNFPMKEQLFIAPQIIVHPDGETYFILVSSNPEKSGGLYIIPYAKLIKGEFELYKVYNGPGRGILLPPLLIDINLDGTEDIIVAMFNCTIMAFNGLNFKEIWNFTIPNSEVINIPIPGYYNGDKIPDFMVKHQIGPGFPIYYYSTATVLDGQTGKPLLETPMKDTLNTQMSGLSITVDNFGNDWFLHWSENCFNNEVTKDKYQFTNDPNYNVDLCKLQINSTLVTSLFAFSQHVEPPGIPLYHSEDWKKMEFNSSFNLVEEAENIINSQFEFDNKIFLNKFSNQIIRNKNKNDIQYKNIGNQRFAGLENFYSKNKELDDVEYNQQKESFLNKALDQLSENEWKDNKWENDKLKENNVQSEDNYDDMYDDEEERLITSRQLNEIRLQRSEKNSVRYINNNTNDVENQLDPSMDYTNGQSKQMNYYSSLNFNKTNNMDESLDYMNIPDIDFVDNIKDAEVLDDKKKREVKANNNLYQKENKINFFMINNNLPQSRTIDTNKIKSQLLKKIQEKSIVNFFKRQLKREVQFKKTSWQMEKVIGIQHPSTTGTLLSSLNSNKKNSVDLIFSTNWLPSLRTPFILLLKDLECIQKAEKKLGKKVHFKEKDIIINNCLASRETNYQLYHESKNKKNSKIAFGQIILYRMQIQCVCPEDMLPGQTCKDISKQQSWPGHLGASGSGYFDIFKT